jgi:16S rRNA (uracil1498-N3)-methyltransferase
MTYFLHDAPLSVGETVRLPEQEARHLLGARRIRRGERFALQDPAGRRFSAELAEATRREARARVLAPLAVPPAPALRLALLQAALKDKAAEALIERCTELGVAALCFFPVAHGAVAHAALQAPRTTERWARIAWEACKQSDRQFPPEIRVLPGLEAALAAHPVRRAGADGPPESAAAGWVLHPHAGQTAGDALAALRAGRPPAALHVLIGPEGGLDDAELAAARAAGYLPLRLGPTVLRAEAAAQAVCALALLGLG